MTSLSAQSRNVALVVAAALFMQMLDGVIIVTALPKIARNFNVDTLQMSAGITVYMLATAVLIPTARWAADRFGARRVFLFAIAAFTGASILCGLADDFSQFILARALQGAGGALMFPVGRMIVLRTADKAEIVRSIGLTVWPALFAPVVGPALGGFLTTYSSWRWAFWMNIPLGLLGFVLVWWIVPHDRDRTPSPFDWPGFALCALSLSGLIYGFEALVQGTMAPAPAAAIIALGAAAGLAAVGWFGRARHPLLDFDALRVLSFRTTELLGGAVHRISINATPFLLPLMFQVAFGLDPLQAGGLLVPYFLGNLVMKTVTTTLLRWIGFRTILLVNGTLAAISIALCGIMGAQTPYGVISAILFVAGLTRSMQFTALATLAFADIDAEHRNAAATLSSMSQQITAVVSIALAAGILGMSRTLGGHEDLVIGDFHLAFWLMAAICLLGVLQYLQLPSGAGGDVSGHQLTPPATARSSAVGSSGKAP
ncbi:MAG: MFS transporter [Devosia sp.]